MYQAIYVHTGAYDAVITEKGVFPVDERTLYCFLNASSLNDDFSEWEGGWEINWNNNDNIWDAALDMGDIVAYYDKNNTLHICDGDLWEERLLFWSDRLRQ